MPIYEYISDSNLQCEHCERGFEKLQKISEHALTSCPKCGNSVRRVMSAPNIARQDVSLERSNLEKHGFTQYKKAEKGVYEKTAGKGPEILSDD